MQDKPRKFDAVDFENRGRSQKPSTADIFRK
jgi:hypothetical protein